MGTGTSKKPINRSHAMRNLTNEETRRGAKRIAVENFLGSMPEDLSFDQTRTNVHADAASYKWNDTTVAAIMDGVIKAYAGK